MISKFLQDNAVQLHGNTYMVTYAVIHRIAEEFNLEYDHGDLLSFTTIDGDEYQLMEATVH